MTFDMRDERVAPPVATRPSAWTGRDLRAREADWVVQLSPQQIEAMDLLDALSKDPDIHLSMAFQPGDMQFLHNHVILHSRNDFENWPQPERHRHLLRLWLAPVQGRPLPEVFAPRYGSVTPGARGGIVVRGTRPTVPMEAA